MATQEQILFSAPGGPLGRLRTRVLLSRYLQVDLFLGGFCGWGSTHRRTDAPTHPRTPECAHISLPPQPVLLICAHISGARHLAKGHGPFVRTFSFGQPAGQPAVGFYESAHIFDARGEIYCASRKMCAQTKRAG